MHAFKMSLATVVLLSATPIAIAAHGDNFDTKAAVHDAAKVFTDFAQHGRAARLTRDLRWSVGTSGALTGLFGEPLVLSWEPKRITNGEAARRHAERFFARYGRAFGLDSLDTISAGSALPRVTVGDKPTQWTVAISRSREGLRVLNEQAVIAIDKNGDVRWIVASFTPDIIAHCVSGMTAFDGEGVDSVGLWVEDSEVGPKLEMVMIMHNSNDVLAVDDHRVIAKGRREAADSFDTIVTTRGVGNICNMSQDFGCTSDSVGLTECADAGKPAWSSLPIGNPPAKLCCPQCMPDCLGACAANCVPDAFFNADVLTGVTTLDTVRFRLAQNGITTYTMQTPDRPVALSPSDVGPGNIQTCGQCGGVSAACPPATNCVGNGMKVAGQCAMAFRAIVGWHDVACSSALGAAAGVIMATSDASKSVSIIAHEFGHLWQRAHGIFQAGATDLLSQPAAIAESVADAFALVALESGWLIGNDSDCARFRSACRPNCIAPAADEPDVTCTGNAGPGKATCTSNQPRHYRDFELKPDATAPDAQHFNTGIINFAHFLFASTAVHHVGNQEIIGAGRLALGQTLANYPSAFVPAMAQTDAQAGTPPSTFDVTGLWTFDGFREAMVQSAFGLGQAVGQQLARAYDAAGIWRPERATDLFGIDRVAMMTITGAAAPQPLYPPDGLLYLVNYDGVSRNVMERCVKSVTGTTCESPVILEPPFIDQPYPPFGASGSFQLDDGSAVMVYPTLSGQIAFQHFTASGPTIASLIPLPPTVFGGGWAAPGGTLDSIRGFGIGAARASNNETFIAYLCVDAACTCAGQAAVQNPMVCVRNFEGTVEAIVAHLPQPVPVVRRDHAPAVAVSNGLPVVAWVQQDNNVERIMWSVRPNPAAPNVWTPAIAWQTAGEVGPRDMPTFTGSLIAIGNLPGAGAGSLDEPQDRLYVAYKPDSISTRAFAFASAIFTIPNPFNGQLGNEQFFSRASMGVAQNRNSTKVLQGASPAFPGSLGTDRAVAGGFAQWAGRTFAAVRIVSSGSEPTMPSYPASPHFGFVPPVHYGKVILRSVGWR